MIKEIKKMLRQAARYISKGLEMGAYAETAGGDLAPARLLKQILAYQAKTRPRAADAEPLLSKARQYISKGLEMGAYAETVGGNLFAERLLEQMRTAFGAPPQPIQQHAVKKKPPAQLRSEIAAKLAESGQPQLAALFSDPQARKTFAREMRREIQKVEIERMNVAHRENLPFTVKFQEQVGGRQFRSVIGNYATEAEAMEKAKQIGGWVESRYGRVLKAQKT